MCDGGEGNRLVKVEVVKLAMMAVTDTRMVMTEVVIQGENSVGDGAGRLTLSEVVMSTARPS